MLLNQKEAKKYLQKSKDYGSKVREANCNQEEIEKELAEKFSKDDSKKMHHWYYGRFGDKYYADNQNLVKAQHIYNDRYKVNFRI